MLVDVAFLFTFAAFIGLLWYFGKRRSIFSYPALFCGIFLSWLSPQLIRVFASDEVDAGILALYAFFVGLCSIAVFLGWRSKKLPIKSFRHNVFKSELLIIGAITISIFGAFFNLQLRNVPVEYLSEGQWSGPLTIYVFLAKSQLLGLALSWLIFLRSGQRIALAIAIINFVFFFEMIFIGARRGLIAEIALIIFSGLWLVKRWQPSFAVASVALIAGALFINSVTEVRNATNGRSVYHSEMTFGEYVDAMRQINWTAFLENKEKPIYTYEVVNGAYIVASHHDQMSFYGFSAYWNTLVNRYVPGQIVGQDNKESLKIPTDDLTTRPYGHEISVGATNTGFADAFAGFWFFGASIFYFISRILRKVYDRAMDGSLIFQYLFVLMISDGLMAITHETSWFIVNWPFYLICSGPVFLFARSSRAKKRADLDQSMYQASGPPTMMDFPGNRKPSQPVKRKARIRLR